jgi:hypothetical protein
MPFREENQMVDRKFDAAAHVDHMAPVMGVEVLPAWRSGVILHLETAARMAEMVLSFPLDDHVEIANVFEAGK